MASAKASKGLALARLASDHGVQAEGAIAFGHMPNHIPMLKWTGHTAAMGNTHPDVLRSATEVTLSNDEDGIAVVLERLLG